MLLCALRTGLRFGELAGLLWGDLDFQRRFIEVRRSLHDGGRVELPKNKKIRRVDMSRQLAEELQRLKAARAKEALAKGWGQIPEWVFCNEDGRPLWRSDFERRVFHKIFSKAGLRRIRFHDLRHTFASRLLQNGESPVYVKEQMGHHSIKVTVDIYGHLVPGSNREAVDRSARRNRPQPLRNQWSRSDRGSCGNYRGRNGGAEGIRTPDPKTASLVLSQLSYSPTRGITLPGDAEGCQEWYRGRDSNPHALTGMAF